MADLHRMTDGPCRLPTPDVHAWRSEIAQAHSALRDKLPFHMV